jgi:hypothetical protein
MTDLDADLIHGDDCVFKRAYEAWSAHEAAR